MMRTGEAPAYRSIEREEPAYRSIEREEPAYRSIEREEPAYRNIEREDYTRTREDNPTSGGVEGKKMLILQRCCRGVNKSSFYPVFSHFNLLSFILTDRRRRLKWLKG